MNNISRDKDLEKKIDAYVKGKLSEEEAMILWEQLMKEPEYIELLNTELGVKSIIEKEYASSERSSQINEQGVVYQIQKSWKWIAAAAAIALLVVSINLLQRNSNDKLANLSITNINMVNSLASAQVVRSQKGNISSADSLLNEGFHSAIEGNVDNAVKIYDRIIKKYPGTTAATKAYLNKGIIQYNMGAFANAGASFKEVLDNVNNDPVTKEKAYWYLGNVYINRKDFKKARSAIYNVYIMNNIYRRPAFRLLRKLDYKLGNIDFDDVNQQLKE